MAKLKKRQDKSLVQGQDEFNMAIKVADRIQLEDVRLKSCHCDLREIVGTGRKSFDIERKVKATADRDNSTIFVLADFSLRTFEESKGPSEPFAKIDASFLLAYSADTLEDISDECVSHFGDINGIYNAWPYWREFVQNAVVRMGLPSLTIPVFRLTSPAKPGSEAKATVKKKTVAKKKKKKAKAKKVLASTS